MCEALDKKKEVRVVFCDISKAFDRVWHEGLLYKLEAIGIIESLLLWFKSYLSNRKQKSRHRQQLLLHWPNKGRDTSGVSTRPTSSFGVYK